MNVVIKNLSITSYSSYFSPKNMMITFLIAFLELFSDKAKEIFNNKHLKVSQF